MATALTLGAFTDEISHLLDEQVRHCIGNGIRYFELRGVNNTGVLDLDAATLKTIKQALDDNGLGVISIGSPIGKVRITDDFNAHFDKFRHAVDLAEYFSAPFVRIFSYYPAEGATHDDLIRNRRDEVMRRMGKKADYMRGRAPVLVHENEADIYGEKAEQCLDMLATINSPKLRAAFDFANFVQAKVLPLHAWNLLKPYVVHIHVKDANWDTGKNVPPGAGDGKIAEILKDALDHGYAGTLTLEPHLSAAGQFSGFSGPDLFKTAADAFKAICQNNHVALSLR